ncbi:hypothetical protein P43SY_002822 [Pythium insidiosum]|uniref:Uncharacterized protein n=1 Tax=Pythium insidiosum TaxID=114742 RepID=A0AAD5QEK4_PYTIN|nr:hypothetical protein P43SY_002822 [Pythium insidiosum]
MEAAQDGGASTAQQTSNAAAGSPSLQPSGKSGPQLLHELLAISYHVFEEAKYMNLKPPLQPSSRMFSLDTINAAASAPAAAPHSPPRSPSQNAAPESPSDDPSEHSNGTTHFSHHPHGHHLAMQPVIPFSPEEIQDSFTRIATLKAQYTKVSTELLALVQQLEARRADPELAQQHAEKEQEIVQRLIERRNQLRREVYERNLVMKGMIDRLRHLQYSMRLIRGSNTTPSSIVMETV